MKRPRCFAAGLTPQLCLSVALSLSSFTATARTYACDPIDPPCQECGFRLYDFLEGQEVGPDFQLTVAVACDHRVDPNQISLTDASGDPIPSEWAFLRTARVSDVYYRSGPALPGGRITVSLPERMRCVDYGPIEELSYSHGELELCTEDFVPDDAQGGGGAVATFAVNPELLGKELPELDLDVSCETYAGSWYVTFEGGTLVDQVNLVRISSGGAMQQRLVARWFMATACDIDRRSFIPLTTPGDELGFSEMQVIQTAPSEGIMAYEVRAYAQNGTTKTVSGEIAASDCRAAEELPALSLDDCPFIPPPVQEDASILLDEPWQTFSDLADHPQCLDAQAELRRRCPDDDQAPEETPSPGLEESDDAPSDELDPEPTASRDSNGSDPDAGAKGDDEEALKQPKGRDDEAREGATEPQLMGVADAEGQGCGCFLGQRSSGWGALGLPLLLSLLSLRRRRSRG